MTYKLIISDKANEELEHLVYYLIHNLKVPESAKRLLDEVEKIYKRLEDNPFQFSVSRDDQLQKMGYREAVVHSMNYKIIYRIEKCTVYIVGVFHNLENYVVKI